MANGLLNNAPDQGAPAPPMDRPGMDQGMMGEDGEQSNVSPEEQAAYEQFVANGLKLIFNEQTAPKLIASLQAEGNPVHALANATVMIVQRLEQSAAKAGQTISPDILMHGGAEIMSNIAELAKAAKIHEFSEEELESASYVAMDLYGDQAMKQGTLDKNAIAQDVQTIVQADQQGTLEQVVPGIEEAAARAKARKPMDEEAPPEQE